MQRAVLAGLRASKRAQVPFRANDTTMTLPDYVYDLRCVMHLLAIGAGEIRYYRTDKFSNTKLLTHVSWRVNAGFGASFSRAVSALRQRRMGAAPRFAPAIRPWVGCPTTYRQTRFVVCWGAPETTDCDWVITGEARLAKQRAAWSILADLPFDPETSV